MRVTGSDLMDRISGTRGQPHHAVRLLRDSAEHEAAVLDLIHHAQHHLIIEHYLLDDDAWGQILLSALIDRIRAGVTVYVLLDWFGSLGHVSRQWIRTLRHAGGQCLLFNPPDLLQPIGFLVRNHRKLVSADGCDAILGGWCLSAAWRGRPGEEAWRDTGVRLHGSLVAEAEAAFAVTWQAAGGTPPETHAHHSTPPWIEADGLTTTAAQVRLLRGEPATSPLLRLDLLHISWAQERICITDAYPVGTPMYLHALREAAQAGVDVRLLVPGSTDVPLLGLLARTGYRALLEAGVRVYEWNGPMLHAKTAVFDSLISRVGSSNLNPASWMGNYELDLLIEDESFGALMTAQFDADLDHATEIVLGSNHQVALSQPRQPIRHPRTARLPSLTTLRVSRAVVQAVRESRPLSPSDSLVLALLGSLALLFSGVAWWRPEAIAWPLGLLSFLTSFPLLRAAFHRYRRYRNERRS